MRRLRALPGFLLLLFAGFLAARPLPADEPHDLLIRGGRVVDGTGNPWFAADVAVRGDRIAFLGRGLAGEARRTIDAAGLVVAPGFIDIHSHSDLHLLEDGNAESKVRQGVTTEVLGESSSAGPARGKLPPASALVRGEKVEWTTLGGYFAALERGGIAVNVASYCGLGTIWRCALGDSFARPSAEEIRALEALLEEAMDDGALGLSSVLASPPDMLATHDELVLLAGVAARRGGIFSSHIRNEGTGVLDAVREAIAVGERARVPVDIIHLKIADQQLWGRMNEVTALIEDARRRGVDVQANVYPYTRGNNNLASIVPPWAHEGGREQMLARLRDPAARVRLKAEIRRGLPGWYNHYLAVGGDWSRIIVNDRLGAKNREFEGRAMNEILAAKGAAAGEPAAAGGRDGLDVLFDFLLEEDGPISAIYAHHAEEDMNAALAQPWCSIGSDGLAHAVEGPLRRGRPHPRSFGTFPRVLGVYVRERGLLSLEEAVRKMTSLNAAKIGLCDRGLLRPGAFADITVFDPAKVIDRATYADPFQYPEGIEYVVVNGQVTIERGKHTGARGGRVLRRAGFRSSSSPSGTRGG
jgi:N-acyl-D-aspartate/D-glutamate deacylase